MRRLAACVGLVLVAGCDNLGSSWSERVGMLGWGPTPAVAAPANGKVAGTLTISGALTGTFTWNETLAIEYCVWEPSLPGATLR